VQLAQKKLQAFKKVQFVAPPGYRLQRSRLVVNNNQSSEVRGNWHWKLEDFLFDTTLALELSFCGKNYVFFNLTLGHYKLWHIQ
jgi:hypothetical protein